MSDDSPRGGLGRPIAWLAIGILAALLGAAAITPTNAYDFSVIAPMLLIIVVGLIVTIWAGFRGQEVQEEHQLLRRLEASDGAAAAPATDSPSEPSAPDAAAPDNGQDR